MPDVDRLEGLIAQYDYDLSKTQTAERNLFGVISEEEKVLDVSQSCCAFFSISLKL